MIRSVVVCLFLISVLFGLASAQDSSGPTPASLNTEAEKVPSSNQQQAVPNPTPQPQNLQVNVPQGSGVNITETAEQKAERMRVELQRAKLQAAQAQKSAEQAMKRLQQHQASQQQQHNQPLTQQIPQQAPPHIQQPTQQQNPQPTQQPTQQQNQQPSPPRSRFNGQQRVDPDTARGNPNYKYQKRTTYENIDNTAASADYRYDGSISTTNEIRSQQVENTVKVIRQIKPGKTKDYTFELKTIQQYYIDVPIAQEFYMKCQVYIQQRNHYKQIENTENESQTRFTITTSDNRLVADEKFYFQAAVAFNATAETRYTIKFYNVGRQKLITTEIKYMTQRAAITEKLSTDDTQLFSRAIGQFQMQIDQAIVQFRRLWFYDYRRTQEVADMSRAYFIYEIVEIFLAGMVAFFQVRMVNKLLKGGSDNVV